MEQSPIAFIIPFWGTDLYRHQSYGYLHGVLNDAFKAWDPPAMGYGLREGDPHERSAARNLSAARALDNGAEVLVFVDADSIPDPLALGASIDNVTVTKKWLLPYRTYYNLTEAGSEIFMREPPWTHWRPEDGYEYEYVFPGPDPRDRPPAVGGCVIVHKDAWLLVRGYDERFLGWGGEDRAFVYALQTMVGDCPRYPAPIYHLWHPAPEDQRFDNPDWERNRELLKRYEYARQYPLIMSALVNER